MNVIRKLSIVFLVLIIFVSIFETSVYADNFDLGAFNKTGVAGTANVKNLVNNSAATIITVARVVCVTIAIVVLLVIAMKYMTSAPGDRADIKKHAIHYTAGVLLLFAVPVVLSLINNFAQMIKAN